MISLVSPFTIWLFGHNKVRLTPDFQTSGTNRKIAQHIDGETEPITAFSIPNFALKCYLNFDKSSMYAINQCLICSAQRNDNQLRTVSLSVHWLWIWQPGICRMHLIYRPDYDVFWTFSKDPTGQFAFVYYPYLATPGPLIIRNVVLGVINVS